MSDRCQTGCGNRQAFGIWFESAPVTGSGQTSPGMQWTEILCKSCSVVRKDQVTKEGGKVVDVKTFPEAPAAPIWAPELEPAAVASDAEKRALDAPGATQPAGMALTPAPPKRRRRARRELKR